MQQHHPSVIRLATRGSRLAMAQAHLAAEALRSAWPGREVVILEVETTGDRQTTWSLETEGGKGLFTKEIEEALWRGEADVAVHSAKDLPTEEPPGLVIGAYLPREMAHDILVVRTGIAVPTRLASGSPRRREQLKARFPQAVWQEFRGNVETRLKKIAGGEAEATVLAAAGLRRLGITRWDGLDFRPLGLREVVPAVGQGAVALQVRAGEEWLVEPAGDEATGRAVSLERRLLRGLGGGCHTATAGHVTDGTLLVFHADLGFLERKLPDLAATSAAHFSDQVALPESLSTSDAAARDPAEAAVEALSAELVARLKSR